MRLKFLFLIFEISVNCFIVHIYFIIIIIFLFDVFFYLGKINLCFIYNLINVFIKVLDLIKNVVNFQLFSLYTAKQFRVTHWYKLLIRVLDYKLLFLCKRISLLLSKFRIKSSVKPIQ